MEGTGALSASSTAGLPEGSAGCSPADSKPPKEEARPKGFALETCAEELDPAKLSSFLALVVNLAKTIVGSGILLLPSAARLIGVFPGMFLLVLAAVVSAVGLDLYLQLCKRVGRKSSLQAISDITYKQLGVWFNIVVAVKCLLVAALYLNISATTASLLLDKEHRMSWFKVIAAVLVIPVALMQRTGPLRYTSLVGMIAVAYLCLLSVYLFFWHQGKLDFPSPEEAHSRELQLFTGVSAVEYLKQLPTFMFTYTCHQNIFPLYNEAKNNSMSSMRLVVWASISIASVAYVTFTLFSASTFRSCASGTVLAVYISQFRDADPGVKVPSYIGGYLYIVLLLVSYPLQTLALKLSVLAIAPISEEFKRKRKGWINSTLSLSVVVITMLLILFIPDIRFVRVGLFVTRVVFFYMRSNHLAPANECVSSAVLAETKGKRALGWKLEKEVNRRGSDIWHPINPDSTGWGNS